MENIKLSIKQFANCWNKKQQHVNTYISRKRLIRSYCNDTNSWKIDLDNPINKLFINERLAIGEKFDIKNMDNKIISISKKTDIINQLIENHEIEKKDNGQYLIIKATDLQNFANSLINKLSESKSKQNKYDELFTQPEACIFIKKSRQTLVKWRKYGYIKAYTIGGRVYFKKHELIDAAESL